MIAEVIVDISASETDKIYDYILPNFINHPLGKRVVVPFGRQETEGYIIGIKEESHCLPEQLKEIICAVDHYPVILPEMIELMNFMTEKYHLRKADCLKLFITAEMRGGKIRPLEEQTVFLTDNYRQNLSSIRRTAKNQIALVEYLEEVKEENNTSLALKFTYSALAGLKEKHIIDTKTKEILRKPVFWEMEDKKIHFTFHQQHALLTINEGKTYLLHGVTGSGKTEVYMGLIQKALSEGKTAIMLVPEISLTPQVLGNFKARFGENVALLHSGLSAGAKFDEWRRLLQGKAKIAVGARSAVFAPLSNLGIVIIDEEHEQSYVSESNPRYRTHDVAGFRCTQAKCPLVLGSATPSIETYQKTVEKQYTLLELPNRINSQPMPPISVVDMLSEIRYSGSLLFSRKLLDSLQKTVTENKQAMIFLNRRGYSSFMMCKECGYVAKCDDCDVSLVYHKFDEKLKCHFCGRRYHALTECSQCHSKSIRGGATGTQQLVEELKKLFPDVKILRMDNDSTGGKDGHHKILEEFSKTAPCILVGTQMIAKGHDFPLVTTVGIIDADQGLYQSDYKACEHTFALITQVAGRAGRGLYGGEVILQTYNSRHYVYRFAVKYDYKGFFEKEVNLRKVTKFPPFSTIVRLLYSGENENDVMELLKAHHQKIKTISEENPDAFLYFEGMKSPYGKIKNKYRMQILVRIEPRSLDLMLKKIYAVCDEIQSKKVSCFVEINPSSLS